MPDPLFLSIAELTEHFRQRTLSAVEVLEAALARSEQIQSSLNAFRLIDSGKALGAARESEDRWARGEPLFALDGVPIAIKDNQPVAGQKRTAGSLALRDVLPSMEDAPHVARLREAGAILYTRTNLPDLAWKAVTDSPLSGVTRNPWNPLLTPGCSSGGAAVAVATGCVPLATGSDGGGSIRIPAAFTGTYGLKPTIGRIPGICESPDITAIGPLTRSVWDAALALEIMCRANRDDPMAAALTVPDFVAATGAGVKGLKVAVSATLGYIPIDAKKLIPLEEAARVLAEAGALVEVAFAAASAAMKAEQMALLDPALIATCRRGMMTSAAVERLAQIERIKLMQTFAKFFGEYDLLLTPCVPIAPFAAGVNLNTPDEHLNPEWYDWTPYTWVYYAAKLPAASCPWGLDEDGLPLGVQVAAAHFREDLILRASAVLEAAKPYLRSSL